MNKNTDYITKEKKAELERELEELRGPKRKEILDALQYAKSLGDLSENAEYHQAREDQGKLESRIKKIEHILRVSEVVAPTTGAVVGIGSRVTVIKDGESEKREYIIVGGEEADMKEGKISNRSPFGSVLFGRKKGDLVTVETPRGSANYKIIDVS